LPGDVVPVVEWALIADSFEPASERGAVLEAAPRWLPDGAFRVVGADPEGEFEPGAVLEAEPCRLSDGALRLVDADPEGEVDDDEVSDDPPPDGS
jgi:hypothetical protein